MKKIKSSYYIDKFSFTHKFTRYVWNIIWFIFAKPFPRRTFNFWKIFLLKLFGANIDYSCVVYSSAKIYMPWNLYMDPNSSIGPEVDVYNVDRIYIGSETTISQKSYLCSASHDISKPNFPLITMPIIIKDQVWVGASAFLAMGVKIGTGAVIGARSSVFKDVSDWDVVGGNPAKFISRREVIK